MTDSSVLIAQSSLLQRLLALWQQAEQDDFSVSIFVIDIDNYAQLENKAGCFEKVLQSICHLFKRETDYLTRFNRKQILVITTELSFQQSNQLAERIHKAVAKLKLFHPYSPTGRYLTLSIGHTTYSPLPDDDYGVLDMLAIAFTHLSNAKQSGGNCSETRLRPRLLK